MIKGIARLGLVCLIIFLFDYSPGYGQQAGLPTTDGTVLTNSDVQKMVDAKLSEGLIINKIKTSTCSFDTTTDTILKLKSQGAPDAVIEAMVACGKPVSQTSPAAAPPPNPNNPLSQHAPGIYWLLKKDTIQTLTRLEASSYGGSKSAGVMGSAFSMGMKKAKWKAQLAGAHAALRINNTSPEFWFYFENASAGFGHSGPGGQASKPEDFSLARMDVQKTERQLVVGQASAFGNSSGLRDQDKVPVTVQKMGPGVFRVTVNNSLEPGEYCFVPPGSAAAFGMAGGQLYDFGVEKP